MKYLAVLALFVAAAMAAEDQDAQGSKHLRPWRPQHAPLHKVPSHHPKRWGRSVEAETDDQQADEWHSRPYYGRPSGGWGYGRRWRRSTDDQDTEENHRRPYYGSSHYRPSYNRYGRSVDDAEVQLDDQQIDESHYRRYRGYGGYGGHYGGYYGGYGHRRPYWG